MPKPLSQYFEELSEVIYNTPSNKDKATILQQGITDESTKLVVKRVFGMVFDPRVKFTLPEGDLPEEVAKDIFQGRDPLNDFGNEEVLFYKVLRGKLNYIIQGTPETLKDNYKAQRWFIDALKEMHVEDARFLVELKDKKWPYRGFDQQLISEVFPEVVPPELVKKSPSPQKTQSKKGTRQKIKNEQNTSA